jgi:spore germination protein GerM
VATQQMPCEPAAKWMLFIGTEHWIINSASLRQKITMNKPILIGVSLFLIVLVSIVFVVRHRQIQSAKTVQSKTAAPAAPLEKPAPTSRSIKVKLYFGNKNSTQLIPEDRSIVYQEDLRAQAREVLAELLAGPQTDLNPTIPANTQLRDLFITKDGIAYVDFSAELVNGHNGGSDGEINTVYSIVNTLTLNFPQIKKVQILVEDQVVQTLKGHLDLSRPLR